MARIDFHTHTTASDGVRSPRDLVDFARKNGVIALAVTDHDTVEGLAEAVACARETGFFLVPGIEFSIDFDRGSFHLVGLNIDYAHPPLLEKICWLNERRDTRALRMVEDLNRHGIGISAEEVIAQADGGAIGRPHVARVLVKHGYAQSTKQVFENYLVPGRPGYVKKEKISFTDAMKLIKDAGGVAVLAHPSSLEYVDYGELDGMLREFVDNGLDGIEVYASMHTDEMVAEYLRLADRYDLFVSGGSDYHGDKDETIGYYRPDAVIPERIYEGYLKLVGA